MAHRDPKTGQFVRSGHEPTPPIHDPRTGRFLPRGALEDDPDPTLEDGMPIWLWVVVLSALIIVAAFAAVNSGQMEVN